MAGVTPFMLIMILGALIKASSNVCHALRTTYVCHAFLL